MSVSIFISMPQKVSLAFKRVYFPQMYEKEMAFLSGEDEGVVSEKYDVPDQLVWLNVEAFLLGKEENISHEISLPYLGIDKNPEGVEPLAQQLKARIRTSLDDLREKDPQANVPELGKDLVASLPEEFLHCEYVLEYQKIFARFYFLLALKESYEKYGEKFPVEFLQASEEARAKMEMVSTEFLFRSKSHFSCKPCHDCTEDQAKILRLNGC